MKNIVKAQFFQLIRDKIIGYMLFVTLLMQVLTAVLPIILDEAVPSVGEFLATSEGGIPSFPIFFLVLVTAQICGGDFMDKTHNYELMSGHKRWEVYLGRVIPALLVGGVGSLLLMLLPVGIYATMYEWGTKVVLGEVLLRWALMLLPLLRLVCEMACLTFLVKNPYVVMGVGYMTFMASFMIVEMCGIQTVFLATTNLTWLQAVNKWVTYGLGNTYNYIYNMTTTPEMLFGTVIASVVFGLAALYLGYVFYQNDDMN